MKKKTTGYSLFNMTVSTKIHKGEQSTMAIPGNQVHSAESDTKTFTKKPIVDWSEETVKVNGRTITVVFPDESKILEDE